MAAGFASLEIRTTAKVAVINVTTEVRRALERAGVRTGLALVSVPHTTCAVCVNEDEAGLKDDLARVAARLLDPLERAAPFLHDRIDNNARAHLAAAVFGNAAAVPISGGDLRLGTWQSLFLLELDGPRSRRLEMTFVGE